MSSAIMHKEEVKKNKPNQILNLRSGLFFRLEVFLLVIITPNSRKEYYTAESELSRGKGRNF